MSVSKYPFLVALLILVVVCIVYIAILSKVMENFRLTYRNIVRAITATIFLLYFLLFISIWGCWAVIVKARKLVIMYVIANTILVIIDIVIVVGFVETSRVSHVRETLNIKQYTGKMNNKMSFQIDSIQFQYRCCGMKSYKEYQDATHWIFRDRQQIPVSCCPQTDRIMSLDPANLIYKYCHTEPLVNNSYISRGCQHLLSEQITDSSKVLIACMYICIFAQILCIITGLIFALLSTDKTV